MKSAFSKIILSCSVLFAVVAGGFVFILILLQPEQDVLVLSVVFIAVMAVLFSGFLLAVRREMLSTLSALSTLIQELINGGKSGIFPENEDTLLSKLQSQLLQLSGLLTAQKQRYREESREVKSLISDISHQLKTPLANLAIYSGLLQDDGLPDDKRREFTRHMEGQIEKLSWLMESLIKLSRLESGIIELRPEMCKLEDAVLAAVKQAFPAAQSQGIEIVLEGSGGTLLRHDHKWTAEAIYNVIDNAIKYTVGTGSITITMSRYDLFARIDVRDHGTGIPAEEINAVFQRFYRGRNAGDTEGVGIGLYLAREIITQQGGYMKVRSVPGEGSTFSLFLPLQAGSYTRNSRPISP